MLFTFVVGWQETLFISYKRGATITASGLIVHHFVLLTNTCDHSDHKQQKPQRQWLHFSNVKIIPPLLSATLSCQTCMSVWLKVGLKLFLKDLPLWRKRKPLWCIRKSPTVCSKALARRRRRSRGGGGGGGGRKKKKKKKKSEVL